MADSPTGISRREVSQLSEGFKQFLRLFRGIERISEDLVDKYAAVAPILVDHDALVAQKDREIQSREEEIAKKERQSAARLEATEGKRAAIEAEISNFQEERRQQLSALEEEKAKTLAKHQEEIDSKAAEVKKSMAEMDSQKAKREKELQVFLDDCQRQEEEAKDKIKRIQERVKELNAAL